MKKTDNHVNYVSKLEFYSIVTSLIILMSSLHYASIAGSERLSLALWAILTILMFIFLFATIKARKELAKSGGARNKTPADNKDSSASG